MSFVENSSWEILFWPTSKSYWKAPQEIGFHVLPFSHDVKLFQPGRYTQRKKGFRVEQNKTFWKWKISPPKMFCFVYSCSINIQALFVYSTRGTNDQLWINTHEISISIFDSSFILGILPSIESQPSVKRFHVDQQRQSFYFRWAEEKHHDCFKLKKFVHPDSGT